MTARRGGGDEPTLSESLVRLAHVVDYVFADVSRDFGLTPQQTQLLCVLTTGPTRMGALSHTLHLERSSLTGLVDRVSARGLIERVADPDDGRACTVALTARGRRIALDAHGRITARLDELAGETPERSRTALARLADGIAANYTRPSANHTRPCAN